MGFFGVLGGIIGAVVGTIAVVAGVVAATAIAPVVAAGAVVGIVACITNTFNICPGDSATTAPTTQVSTPITPTTQTTPTTPSSGGTTGGTTSVPPPPPPSSNGSSSKPPPPPSSSTSVKLSDSSNGQSVPGASYRITWQSSNVSNCTVTETTPTGIITADWGTGANSSRSTNPTVLGRYTYRAACSGSRGTVTDSLVHTVASASDQNTQNDNQNNNSTLCTTSAANACGMRGTGFVNSSGVCSATVPPNSSCPAPTIDPSAGFYADPSLVRSGESSTLHWSATNATTCSISGSLTATSRAIAGSMSTGAITAKSVYTLTCVNGVGGPSASQSTAVNLIPAVQEL